MRPVTAAAILSYDLCMPATLAQVNVSPGGMPKLPVLQAMATRAGVEGDWQKNRKYHGGPDRAVCLYSQELYAWLRGHDIDVQSGDLGENFTTAGLDLQSLSKGDRLRVGACIIEITDIRVPCSQLRKWSHRLPKMLVGRSGWMAKVIQEGLVRPGNLVEPLGCEGIGAKAFNG